MQFALLIFESPEAFAARNADENDPYLGAWRAYYKALVEADIYVGGNPLQPPETGTTVRLKDGKRRVQDGPFADTKEQLGGFTILASLTGRGARMGGAMPGRFDRCSGGPSCFT